MAVYSIIKKSKLESAQRIDAEYYQPEYLQITKNLNVLKAIPIREVVSNPKRKFRPEESESFRYIEISEVDLNTGEYSSSHILSENAPDRAQWIIKQNDVIVSTVRPIRNAVSLINEGKQNLVCSSGFAVLEPKRVEPEYLFVYLKSRPLVKLLDRLTTATMYPAVTTSDILDTKIYLGTNNFRKEIRDKVINALKQLEQSKILYSQAENSLMEELGLKDFKPKDVLTYVVNLSNIGLANRIDAEYFQPKYEKFNQCLAKFKLETLENLCSMINYGTVPTSPYIEDFKNGTPYVKGENLSSCFIDHGKIDYLENISTKILPNKFYLKEGDIVISQMGTVGNVGVATKEEEGWLFASFTIRARLKQNTKPFIDPLFVALYIQNISRPYYLLRCIAQASVRQNTDLPTIKKLPIPVLPKMIQQKIADLVRKSHETRKKAKELLEEAKQKVEKMIDG